MSAGIVMTFDTVSDTRIRQLWSALETPGLIVPNLGRPHLTLALIDEADLGAAGDALADLAAGMHGTTIAVDSIGLFPGEQPVLFLNPVASGVLLALHRRVHAALRNVGIVTDGPGHNYVPGRWVPHVTLGRAIDAAALDPAIRIANRFRLRFEVTGIALMAVRTELQL
ncbi:MAG: 2'-5' RNA ligase family protein [Thermomicrobiales bacterium]